MKRSSLLVVVFVGLLPCPLASQDSERLHQQACDSGDMVSCNILGLMYLTGEGVTRDPARAFLLYTRACEGGEFGACTNLGVMYQAGEGISQNLTRAASLYQRACDGGEIVGCDNLLAIDQLVLDVAQPDEFPRSGQVADAGTRDPLSEAIVELPELGIRMISDDSGRVDLGLIPTGRYRLRAERVGYEILEGELEVPWNEDFLILLDPATIDDPLAPGRIVGRVTEEGRRNRGVSNVDITVLNPAGVRTLSNQEGRFNLTGLEPGLVEVQFARLGYMTRTTTLIVQPGGIVDINAPMSADAIKLDAIEVTVRSAYLERNGFYERARLWGKQFTRAELDAIDARYLSDVFWRGRIPFVTVRYGSRGAQAVRTRLRRGGRIGDGCVLTAYLDGRRMPGWEDLDAIAPESLEAMEVILPPGIPARYRLEGGCGVVLLWTKR